MQKIEARLEKLEQSNRRLKTGCVLGFLCLATFLSAVGAQTEKKRIIEADEIRLRTTKGGVQITPHGLIIDYGDTSGDGAVLTAGGITFLSNHEWAALGVDDPQMGHKGPLVFLRDKRGTGALGVLRLKPSQLGLSAADFASLEIPEYVQTPAATIVLLDENGKVIWRQPNGNKQ